MLSSAWPSAVFSPHNARTDWAPVQCLYGSEGLCPCGVCSVCVCDRARVCVCVKERARE